MKFIDEVNEKFWEGKRVLLRVGFDVGKNAGAMEEFRIRSGRSSIEFLLSRGAKIILLNHNGRPNGSVVPELSNKPIGEKLRELLQKEVLFIPRAPDSSSLPNAPLILLENTRFNPGEERNDPTFAKQLAELGDAYVNDAFSVSHRNHASIAGIASYLPHFGGLCLKREIEALSQVRDNPEHPLALIIGGIKIETKMKIVNRFWEKAEAIILGGALANTFLHMKGIAVGKSIIEVESAKDIERISLTDNRLHLPVDVRVAKDFEGKEGVRVAPIGKLQDNEIILDIGPDTELLFDGVIKSIKTIIWNGPLGKFEIPQFREGTEHLLTSLLQGNAKVITGGGETVELLEERGAIDKCHFVSTGGAAMLAYLAGDSMPGLEALS